MKRSAFVVVVVSLAAAILTGFDVRAQGRLGEWSIAPLENLPGATFSEAHAINDRHDVVGWSGTSDFTVHAVLWRDGQAIDLGTLGGAMSRAFGINDRGQVVGEAETASGEIHAFLWEDGVMHDLSTAGPFDRGFAINHRGEIAGRDSLEALLWRDGVLIPLGTGALFDINDRGVIAGILFESGTTRAALWRDGSATPLVLPETVESVARALNKHGVVVGWAAQADGHAYAFRWKDGAIVQLPGLLPDVRPFPIDVNDHGVVVGESLSRRDVPGGAGRAVVWLDDVPVDLGTLPGGAASYARAINHHGVIAGVSFDATGRTQAVMWVPQKGRGQRGGSGSLDVRSDRM